jgi:hypothetical protein
MWVRNQAGTRIFNLERVTGMEQILNEPTAGQDRIIVRWSLNETGIVFEGPHDESTRVYGAILRALSDAGHVANWQAITEGQ